MKVRCMFGWHPGFIDFQWPHSDGWLYVERRCEVCKRLTEIFLEPYKQNDYES